MGSDHIKEEKLKVVNDKRFKKTVTQCRIDHLQKRSQVNWTIDEKNNNKNRNEGII